MIRGRLRAVRDSMLLTANHHDYKNAQGQSMPPTTSLPATPARYSTTSLPATPARYSGFAVTPAVSPPPASPLRYNRVAGRGSAIFQAPDGTIYREKLLHPDTMKETKVRGDGTGLIRHPFATDEDDHEVHDLGIWRSSAVNDSMDQLWTDTPLVGGAACIEVTACSLGSNLTDLRIRYLCLCMLSQKARLSAIEDQFTDAAKNRSDDSKRSAMLNVNTTPKKIHINSTLKEHSKDIEC